MDWLCSNLACSRRAARRLQLKQLHAVAAQLSELMKEVLDLQKENQQTIEAGTQTKEPFAEPRKNGPAVLPEIVVSEAFLQNARGTEKNNPILERHPSILKGWSLTVHARP